MDVDRREFLAAALAATAGSALLPAPLPAAERTRLILLGTRGGPRVNEPGRRNASTLLLIGGVPYVVDCGYGTSRQLLAAGVPLETLRHVFITHHHSDHNLEHGTLVYNAWASGLATRVDLWGPPGLRAMTRAFLESMRFDIETRIADEGRPDLRRLVTAHEFDRSGVVLENDDVRITARRVRHPPIDHAYALRFDAKDRSIVVSGDTAYAPALAEFARGADVLVHEVMYLPALEGLLARNPDAKRLREHLLASHTTPEEVGKVAKAAGVGTVVLTHFVPGDDPSITDAQWSDGVRAHFKGRVIVGRDLMEI